MKLDPVVNSSFVRPTHPDLVVFSGRVLFLHPHAAVWNDTLILRPMQGGRAAGVPGERRQRLFVCDNGLGRLLRSTICVETISAAFVSHVSDAGQS